MVHGCGRAMGELAQHGRKESGYAVTGEGWEMILSHFSPRVIHRIYSASDVLARAGHMKPAGFWVSVDGEQDWPAWCESESFTDTEKQYHYRVALFPDAKVLHIKTAQELRDFSAQYGINGEYNRKIDWLSVAKSYHGLIIAPYQWKCHHDEMWYYGWDCASGVIWDNSAIEYLKLIREPVKEAA